MTTVVGSCWQLRTSTLSPRPQLRAPIWTIPNGKRRHGSCETKAWTRLKFWRQIWRVTGRESGSPELLESPRTSPEVSRTSLEVFGDFPGSSLTVELNSRGSSPDFPGSSPDFPGSAPDFPGSSPDFPGGQPFLWEAWHPLLTHKNFPWGHLTEPDFAWICLMQSWHAGPQMARRFTMRIRASHANQLAEPLFWKRSSDSRESPQTCDSQCLVPWNAIRKKGFSSEPWNDLREWSIRRFACIGPRTLPDQIKEPRNKCKP